MAFDADGRCVAHACVVVLANAGDALRLLGPDTWPIEPVRGQLSIGDSSLVGTLPRIPVAGAGYLLPEITGRAVFGATAQPGEFDMALRDEDHSHNLGQLRRLTGRETESTVAALEGRVGIRWSTDDRLPIIGAVPDLEAAKTASRLDQPRFVPRLPGAFAFTALGSRGITWCALGAQVLASSITGAPSPLEASLLDVIDAGRFVSRRARRDTHP
jgi:tRNA 5-methylaminomethyl-2-thiouridine biosynthesis bifunctional protein